MKVGIPLLLSGVILWWMYRGFDWQEIRQAFGSGMRWEWMLLSLPFGIAAQVFRALRWRQALEPMGESPRMGTCVNAIFLSYASSLIVPRVGEVLRCGVLKRWDGISFGRGVGTVVTERVVDMLLVVLLSGLTVLVQIPMFARFFHRTGMSLTGFLGSFNAVGYLVAAACVLLAVLMGWHLARRFHFFANVRHVMCNVREGLFSIRFIRRKGLFLLYSLMIWVSYYLHFYLTFYCFSYTEHLGLMAALVAFVVGTFAVLVPTPNGAGAWHLAVKTVLVLYGVNELDGALFVLVVHTIQTLLVLMLGVYAGLALAMTRKR